MAGPTNQGTIPEVGAAVGDPKVMDAESSTPIIDEKDFIRVDLEVEKGVKHVAKIKLSFYKNVEYLYLSKNRICTG